MLCLVLLVGNKPSLFHLIGFWVPNFQTSWKGKTKSTSFYWWPMFFGDLQTIPGFKHAQNKSNGNQFSTLNATSLTTLFRIRIECVSHTSKYIWVKYGDHKVFYPSRKTDKQHFFNNNVTSPSYSSPKYIIPGFVSHPFFFAKQCQVTGITSSLRTRSSWPPRWWCSVARITSSLRTRSPWSPRRWFPVPGMFTFSLWTRWFPVPGMFTSSLWTRSWRPAVSGIFTPFIWRRSPF